MFDLLVDRNKDVMHKPLSERKARLQKLFAHTASSLLVVDAMPQAGEELFQMAMRLRLDGLTAKLGSSPYLPGVRSGTWRKLNGPGAAARKLK